jgi:signal transduction histidine kinase
MRQVWAQTSLLRDYALLSLATILLFVLVSFWVIAQSLDDYAQNIRHEMETEATRIDRALIIEMEHAAYLLESLGRQVLFIGPEKKEDIARLLKAFETTSSGSVILSWVNQDQFIEVSSNTGVRGKPVDVSDRDYLKKSLTAPWKMQIGRPIRGRISSMRVLPAAIGINDYTGKYIGTIVVSISLDQLRAKLAEAVRRDDLSFALMSKSKIPILSSTESESFIEERFSANDLQNVTRIDHGSGFLVQGNWLSQSKPKLFSMFLSSNNYPFVILLSQSKPVSLGDLRLVLFPKLLQVGLVAFFLLAMLWMIRTRVIQPVTQLTDIADHIALGKLEHQPLTVGPVEIQLLSRKIIKIGQYIASRLSVEEEQRSKLVFFKRSKEAAEFSNRIKVEFLSAMSSEIRTPLNTIVGFSEVMKNQLYGPLENSRYWQYAVDIHRASESLQMLVTDVVALTRAEASLQDVHERPLDVPQLLSRMARQVGELLKRDEITLETSFADGLPRLLMDETRLKQMVLNLVANAAESTPPGGTIHIAAQLDTISKEGPFFVITISDPGMPVARRRGDFSQSSSTDAVPFSSLGLPLTKALVAMHQATLDIDSLPGKPRHVVLRFGKERILN